MCSRSRIRTTSTVRRPPAHLHARAPAPATRAARPHALADLAQNRYFDDPAFVEYLKYLQYWSERPYCEHLVFPHCLKMLELLQSAQFRANLKHAEFKDHVFTHQFQHWHHRWRSETDGAEAEADASVPPGAAPEPDGSSCEPPAPRPYPMPS